MRSTVMLSLLGVAFAALSGPAPASTVRVDEPAGDVLYRAAPGERNVLTVTVTSAPGQDGTTRTFEFEDAVPIELGEGCVHPDPANSRRARCTMSGFDDFGVHVGDGDDLVHVDAAYADGILVGGSGRDRLTGGAGGEEIVGGAGDDALWGGGGGDRFYEGPRANGSDTISGGPNESFSRDFVDYSGRRRTVRASLDDRRNDGALRERDFLGGDLEALVGGAGDDKLTGNAAGNGLFGGPGTDWIAGRGGDDGLNATTGTDGSGLYPPRTSFGGRGEDDRLFGGPGSDSLLGSAGDNLLAGGPGADYYDAGRGADRLRDGGVTVDFMSCGPGRDTARNGTTDVPHSCERARSRSDATAQPIAFNSFESDRGAPPYADVLLGCARRRSRHCVGTAQLELGGEPISAETRFRLSSGSFTLVHWITEVELSRPPAAELTVVIRPRDGGAPEVTPVAHLAEYRNY